MPRLPDRAFLRSAVARRIFLAFVVCALVPITALALLSFRSVTGQLEGQALRRLHEENRSLANGIFERLELLSGQLSIIAATVAGTTETAEGNLQADDLDLVAARIRLGDRVAPHFLALTVVDDQGARQSLLGDTLHFELTERELRHLRAGNTLLTYRAGHDPFARVAMALPIDATAEVSPWLVAEIDPVYLWLVRSSTLPQDADVCFFGDGATPLYCSEGAQAYIDQIAAAIAGARADVTAQRTDAGTLELQPGPEPLIGNFREVPVAVQFFVPELVSVIMRPLSAVVAPRSRFSVYFLGVVLLSLFVVLLLSSVQVRRNLEPLEELRRGTQRIAADDFSARVHVDTGDEFEELGDSFNAMAGHIGELVGELEAFNEGTLTALARAVDAKSPWTAGHSERVTDVAVRIGRAMELPGADIDVIRRGGLVHDIGKIGIPGRILDKPARLTDEEYELLRAHPRKGERILAPIPGYAPIIPIVLQHHERFDGGGYPDGLAGEEIALFARIVAVADTWDAMTSDRPYRKGLERDFVIDTIVQAAGTQFDPAVAAAFERVMRG